MRVSHADDHVTHAVIGGGEGRDFGISDDPTFFQILSSTLYSNQPLAVVREVLCNAWDAHIEAGKVDVPVEITLTDENLIIRDFGSGISDEDMGPIYGIYGGSTKKKNKGVTGGFGLGCKAPFSYSDHFEVTSWHGGRRTIYNLSRSSAEVEGKPGIFPIASFATDETGLQVSIPLKGGDFWKFIKLVHEVVRNGEIKANLNGQLLDVLPFSQAKLGFLIAPNSAFGSTMNVRYGNVIYPIDTHHPELAAICSRASRILDGIGEGRFIFQAKPDTLSVTPSRETLSMTDQTVSSLKKIITSVVKEIEDNIHHIRAGEEKKLYARLENSKSLPHLLDTSSPLIPASFFKEEPFITSIEEIARKQLRRESNDFYYSPTSDDLIMRSCLLEKTGQYDRATVRGYRKALLTQLRMPRRKEFRRVESTAAVNYWFHVQLAKPLKRELMERELSTARLTVLSKEANCWGNIDLKDVDQHLKLSSDEAIRFVRRLAVITFNRTDLQDRLPRFPEIAATRQGSRGVFVYTVPRSFTRIQKVREAFKAAGMTVLDLTVSQPWEDHDVVVPIQRKKRDTLKGIPVLSCLQEPKGTKVPEDPACCKTVTVREEKPAYVVKLPRGQTSECLSDSLNRKASKAAVKLLGEETGVVISATQKVAYLNKGAKPLEEALVDLVLHEYRTNKRIRAHLKRDFTRMSMPTNMAKLLEFVERRPELQRLFKMSTTLTERDWQIIEIGRSLRAHYRPFSIRQASEIGDRFKAVLEQISLDKDFSNFITKLSANRLIDALQLSTLEMVLRTSDDSVTSNKVVSVLKTILKG